MDQIKSLINGLIDQTSLTYDRLPDIDLYMDQVIEYLSRSSFSARENDKISPAMINNYIKDGLLPRANDKKYSREHLACLLMIARLKQTLSVKDTGLLLKSDIADGSIEDYFNGFQHLVAETARCVGDSLPDDDSALSSVALRLAVSGYILNKLEERSQNEKTEEKCDSEQES